MDNLVIEKYSIEKNKSQIINMFQGDKFFLESFLEAHIEGENKVDGKIYVAYYMGQAVGALILKGIGREHGVKTTIYVRNEYRNNEIGHSLFELSQITLANDEYCERSFGHVEEDDQLTAEFLEKRGYYKLCTLCEMEREGSLLPLDEMEVRQYDDEDYFVCDNIIEMAFYKMRERVGIFPPYFYVPSESERQKFFINRNNRYVMIKDGEIIAVGLINGSELDQVTVRNDFQSKGYGRKFVSFLINEIISRGNKTVKLTVVEGNFAKDLYESLGFKVTKKYHCFQKYYKNDTRLSAPPANNSGK